MTVVGGPEKKTVPLQNNHHVMKEDLEGTASTTTTTTTIPSENVSEDTTLLAAADNDNGSGATESQDIIILQQFWISSLLFAAVPAAALACLSLATARLGATVGAWQSGVLYLSYCLTAVLGLSTYLTKQWGSKKATVVGMALYGGAYVGCFWAATALLRRGHDDETEAQQEEEEEEEESKWVSILALLGSTFGGVGAGLIWTAAPVYMALAAERYATVASPNHNSNNNNTVSVTAAHGQFSGIFAFCLLAEETILDVLSTVAIRWCHFSWTTVFASYTLLAMATTVAFYSRAPAYFATPNDTADDSKDHHTHSVLSTSWSSTFYKVTAASDVLINDSKMKYMLPWIAAFSFAGAFLNTFVSGQVVPVALQDAQASYIGILVAWHGAVAAITSWILGRISAAAPRSSPGPILLVGAASFGCVAWPFLVQPDATKWTWMTLLLVYAAQGIGRATFEGTLKAVFADYFAQEKEGAYANIILQNGLSSALAYFLSSNLDCAPHKHNVDDVYCVEYRDGSWHNVWTFAMLVVSTSVLGMLGFARVWYLHEQDQESRIFASDSVAPCGRRSTTNSSSSSLLINRSNGHHEVTHDSPRGYFLLSDAQARALPIFQYNGQDLSLLYHYVLSPLATFCVYKFTPSWVAPNVITLTGFSLMIFSYLLFWHYNPTLQPDHLQDQDVTQETIPRWIFLYNALATLVYQTLDNMDGKQARRTNSSSPLGLLFDHGCDALNSMLGSANWIVACALDPRVDTVWCWCMLFGPYALFYTSTWEEYHTGQLILPPMNGPNEGLVGAAVVSLIAWYYGPHAWQENHLWNTCVVPLLQYLNFAVPSSWSLRNVDFLLWASNFAFVQEVGGKLWHVTWHNGSLSSTLPTYLPFALLVACGTMLVWTDIELFLRMPRTALLLSSILFTDMTTHLMTAHVTGERRRRQERGKNTRRSWLHQLISYIYEDVPFLLWPLVFATLVVMLAKKHAKLGLVMTDQDLDQALLVYATAAITYWACKTVLRIHEMCHVLGIQCFSITETRYRDDKIKVS